MIEATFRFYAELNDFLLPERRYQPFVHSVPESGTIKHIVESFGVPHTEIDLILVNGEPVDFSHQLSDGDLVSVYPVFESMDIRPAGRLRPEPLRHLTFVLDGHLGRLTAFLRMLGFDCWYRNTADDELLASISQSENRVLLTRDVGLLKRSAVTRGYFVRNTNVRMQLKEIVTRFDLLSLIKPFSRCLECNAELRKVEKEAVLHRLEPLTREHYHEFSLCPSCDRIYWKGSHHQRMLGVIDGLGA